MSSAAMMESQNFHRPASSAGEKITKSRNDEISCMHRPGGGGLPLGGNNHLPTSPQCPHPSRLPFRSFGFGVEGIHQKNVNLPSTNIWGLASITPSHPDCTYPPFQVMHRARTRLCDTLLVPHRSDFDPLRSGDCSNGCR